MNKQKYLDGDNVVIHSWGPSHEGKEYSGTIRGISVDDIYPGFVVYIVWLSPTSRRELGCSYSCITTTGACLKRV